MAAAKVVGLRKAFGGAVAVADLHLEVPEGEIFGLVGPDGAGKTTLFRMLLGLLNPDAGEAWLGGFHMRSQAREARERVGYVSQQFSLYRELSVEENMEFAADVRGMDPGEARERGKMLLEWTGMAPFRERRAGALSGGMSRKLLLICALLHRPRIVVLDEPTTGVDPVSRREFWELLYRLPPDGVTLLVSTPFLDEAERCHRLGFMAGGRLLALDTPAGLTRRMPDALVDMRTSARTEARRLLKQRAEVRRVETVGDRLRIAFDPRAPDLDEGRELGRWLSAQGVVIDSCEPIAATLEDVFSALSEPHAEGSEVRGQGAGNE